MQYLRLSSAAQGIRDDCSVLGFGDVRSLIFARVGSLKWKGNKLDLRALSDEWEVKERGERDRGCWRSKDTGHF